MPVKITATDERTIDISIPANQDDTKDLGAMLVDAAHAGYSLTGVVELSGGHQRDPRTVGARFKLTRVP